MRSSIVHFNSPFLYRHQRVIRIFLFETIGCSFLAYGISASQDQNFKIHLSIFFAIFVALNQSGSHFHFCVTLILMFKPTKPLNFKIGIYQMIATHFGLVIGYMLAYYILGDYGCAQLQSYDTYWILNDLFSQIMATFVFQFWNIYLIENPLKTQFITIVSLDFFIFVGRQLTPRTGGSINPSVSLIQHIGFALIEQRMDLLRSDMWNFVLGPVIGSYLAFVVYYKHDKLLKGLLQ